MPLHAIIIHNVHGQLYNTANVSRATPRHTAPHRATPRHLGPVNRARALDANIHTHTHVSTYAYVRMYVCTYVCVYLRIYLKLVFQRKDSTFVVFLIREILVSSCFTKGHASGLLRHRYSPSHCEKYTLFFFHVIFSSQFESVDSNEKRLSSISFDSRRSLLVNRDCIFEHGSLKFPIDECTKHE